MLKSLWYIVQVLIGYNLVFPAVLYIIWRFSKKREKSGEGIDVPQLDYAVIVTAYQQTETLPPVVASILKLNYTNFLVYIVADNCDITGLNFDSDKVILLRPEEVLSSNTKSHAYAIEHFKRDHQILTIIDSDNLVDPEYLNRLNTSFELGYGAVQGLRAAKNLDGTIAALDAARDIYYHFYDGKILYEIGSSATLSGSGMAFRTQLYRDFLEKNTVIGAGFDKVLQAFILKNNGRIAFNEHAVVFDEKTSKSEQLVQQRSRWINTWFKYVKLGIGIIWLGIKRFNRNQFVFGLVLFRPPLFIFLILSFGCFLANILFQFYIASAIWFAASLIFVLFFFIALISSAADRRIYKSLKNIPNFMFYQVVSLVKARRANKISIATKHYHVEGHEDTIK